ncbi:hypothetical protein, partial [Mucilaginibacter sp.]|uniref:beta strand repeat-containing protein n=1 Tax=Mucilaginibacter sp. TaxID=1882438 RepID=UPI0026195E1F
MSGKKFYSSAKLFFNQRHLKRLLSVTFFLIFSLSLLTLNVKAQTPGLIYKPATNGGRVILDPNLDGYTSATASGFQGGIDYGAQSELKMVAIPQGTTEPVADLSTGGAGGQTDLVGGSNSVYVLNDGTNLIIRFRIGKNSSASKGYCLMIDLNGKFGPTDPNYTTTNMGFEKEVTLETNFGVVVTDLVTNTSVTYNYDDHHQRSISATTISGNTNVFYDFYVPISAITSTPATTAMRFAATTITSAKTGTSGTVSDINGIADQTYSGNTVAALSTAITTFPATTLTGMTSGSTFTASLTSAPVITSAIAANYSSISGTSLEANNTTITLYRKVGAGAYTSFGTALVTGGIWTYPAGITLTAGDLIYATATAGVNSESLASNIMTVSGPALCYTPAPVITGGSNGSQTISGTWTDGVTTTGTTVRIRFWQQIANTNTFAEVGPVGSTGLTPATPSLVTFTGTSGVFSISGIQTSQTLFKQGAIYATATLANCSLGSGYSNSDLTSISGSSGTDTPAPTITTSSITASTGSTNVTVQSNFSSSYLLLFVNGTQVAANTTTATATGSSITLSYTGFNAGDIVTARAIASTGSNYLSAASNAITVTAAVAVQSTAPIITGNYYSGTGKTVSGTSVEQSGSTITLYKAGSTVLGTTTVNGFGNWTVTGLTLTAADALTAKVTALGKTISNASNTVTVLAAASAPVAPILTGPIQAGDLSISGTGGAGMVTVYVDGQILGTVTSASAWSLSVLATDIYKGAVIYATNTNTTTLLESASSNTVTATGVDHFLIEANGGGNIATQTAGVAFPIQISARNIAPGNTLFNTYTGTNVISSASTVIGGGGPTGAFTAGALTGWNMTLTTAGTYTLTTLSTGDPTTIGTSNSFVIGPGPANKLAVKTQPSATVLSQVYLAQQPAIYIQDQYGNNVTTDNTTQVTVSLASGTGTLNGQSTVTAVNGVVTFTGLSITGTGSFTLGFAKTGLTGATSGSITVSANTPASPSALSYTTPNVYTINNAITAINPTVTGTITSYTVSPSLPTGLSINAGTGIISGTPTTSAALAVYTVTAHNGTGTTSFGITITVNSLAATQLTITTQPSAAAQSGAAFAQQPIIQLRDGSSNPISQAGINVTAAILTGGGTLGGTVTVQTNASGVATFTDLNISGTIGDRTLQFTSSGLTSVTSNTITLSAGAAAVIRVETAADGTGTTITAQNLTSGNTLTGYSITRDAAGNFVANAAGTWSLTNKTLGAADANLVAAGDNKSAV